MLHPSLTELLADAREVTNLGVARALLSEAPILFRNGFRHGTPTLDLVEWYSDVIVGTLRSPAVSEELRSLKLFPTGALGRRELLPGSPIRVLLSDENDGAAQAALDVLSQAGVHISSDSSARSVSTACAADLLDAGITPTASPAEAVEATLWKDVVDKRPPVYVPVGGFPDRTQSLHINDAIISPVSRLARWAVAPQAAENRSTTERLNTALVTEALTEAEVEALTQAFRTGMDLAAQRWTEGVGHSSTTVDDLSAVERSVYGAAARSVSHVLTSLASANGPRGH